MFCLGLVKAEGVVLKSVKYNDNSRIFTILTREYGKISATAASLKSNKFGLVGGTQPFSYSKFVMYKSERANSLYRLNECELIKSFSEIRESFEKVAYASYFAEISMRASNENAEDEELLRLLLNTLYLLEKDKYSYIKIKTVFELKAVSILGFAPNFDECAVCKRTDNLTGFSLFEGKTVCGNCSGNVSKTVPINNDIIKIVNYILKSDFKKIFMFTASEEILIYLNRISELFLEEKLEYRFKTLDYLKQINN